MGGALEGGILQRLEAAARSLDSALIERRRLTNEHADLLQSLSESNVVLARATRAIASVTASV